nr:FecR domain-containing protein [Sphingomonas sp. Y57]
MPGRETSAQIDAVAAEWAVRVDSAPLDSTEQAALDAWLAGDARRLGAYARARAMLLHAGRAKALGTGFDPDAFLATHGEPSADRHSDANEAALPVQPRGVGRRSVLLGGSGAVAAGVLVSLGLSWQAAAQTFSTKRGEIRLVPLADGSTMTLNTASTARVKFSETERRVELLEGEALFDVAKETSRAFVVAAGETRVHALGTSFTVSRLDRQPVQVLVRQGIVEVVQSGSTQERRRIVANTRAIVSASRSVEVATIGASEVSRELAWREGMLSFEDKPLRNAARDFARYSETHILFEDDAIGDETVTGLFAANNPAGFARSVALGLGLGVRTEPGGIVLIRTN